MPELCLPEEDAARYVLGELTDAERREFESRLAQSAELRALVGELEEGAVALAMASPRQRPPQAVWTRIEKAVAGGERRKALTPAFWVDWWRHGWAVAIACLAGWLLYALWVNRPISLDTASVTVASKAGSQRDATSADSHQEKARTAERQDNAENNAALELLQARTNEIGALRRQIEALTNRVTHLSQAMTQQQALLSESSRFKFFQLTSSSTGSTGATASQISPDLQRALLLAMARELGWSPTVTAFDVGGTESGREGSINPSNSTRTNQAGVDFVDLRPGSNSVATSISQPQVELTPPATSESSSLASASSNAIPGFISGTNVVLAFDSAAVPTGGSLTFLTANSWGQFQSLGTAVLGNNPMVVTIPFSASIWAGGNITVITGTPSGPSNVLGQFSTQGTISP